MRIKASTFSNWWKNMKQHLVVIGIIITAIIFIVIIILIVLGYLNHWNWTGVNGGYSKITRKNIIVDGKPADVDLALAKTLWDWLQLLVVPLVLAIGGFWLNQIQKNRDNQIADERARTDREISSDN